MKNKKKFFLLLPVIAVLIFFANSTGRNLRPVEFDESFFEGGSGESFFPKKDSPEVLEKHAILHISHEHFLHSINNPRVYEAGGFIYAGVVPHHDTAAAMISGFFSAASEFADYYDTVIILAPNHTNDFSNVIVSCRGWDIGEGVAAHAEFAADLLAAEGIAAATSHAHVEGDHSAAILIPYIYYYLPNVRVAPVLLNRALNFDETARIFSWLWEWIYASGENILLVASIDFSHFLLPPEAAERDRVTTAAIRARDFHKLHALCDFYLDSPAAMIIFLKYADALGIPVEIIDRACAADFLGAGLDETTSYKIITAARPPKVRLTFTGDIMLHEAQTAACFTRKFSRVSGHLQSADLAIGNLETVFGGFFMDEEASGFPTFSAPDEFGLALRGAGFDLLSHANNHALDQGVDGLVRSLDFLESIGIDTFGAYRSRAERDNILIREAGGMRFAFLAYTFGTNSREIPDGREYLVNLIHMDIIREDIARAREIADFVIIMPHMGNEYELFVRPEFEDLALQMLESGADIVVAGHPHVVQTMGFVQIENALENTFGPRRGFIAFCLGNFVSSQREIFTETGVMLNLYFEKRGGVPTFAAASYVPTWVKFTNAAGQTDIKILPVAEALRDPAGLRPQDIARLHEIHRELAEIILCPEVRVY